jgi:2-polyprenyl-3-methyl-5-hydroxy-6-metoxy-1,4-benzoquinol methylase
MPSAADAIIDLYERHAHDFAADRGSQLRGERGWLDRFTRLLAPGASILDVGCGSGEPIAAHLIEQGFAVEGIDTSPSLIAMCRERFPDRPWHIADMRTLALGKRFDGILAWDSLFHLTVADQERMFAVFASHAAPHAALMFTSGSVHGSVVGSYRGEPLYHASLAPHEYRELLAAIKFQLVHHVADDPSAGGHAIWLAQRG